MNKIQKQVEEFHRLYGVPIRPRAGFPSGKRVELRLDLIAEEFCELQEACDKRSLIEAVDALGDLLYVVFGAAIEFGVDMESVVDEIHESNLSKLGVDGKPIYAENGKVLKGPNYSPPDIKKALRLKEGA